DLSDEAYRDQYNNVQVNLGYQRFESVGNLRTGEPIVYAATIPTTAQEPEEARLFLDFLLEAIGNRHYGGPQPVI
ncbi:MAG: tungstate ABC transporter substrate-binding protein WtpA, partial [Methanocalculus sp.]|nr:tungstate ABC transporter substrate-binding protein WtpA [Methanocalculus sp.]